MKIIQKCCLIFLTIIIFFSVHGWYIENQKLELLNAYSLKKEYTYWLNLSDTVDNERINDLIKLADKYDVDLIKHIWTDNEENYFLYGDFPNIQKFLNNQDLPDFHDMTKSISYSSSDLSMYVLSNEKTYNVYSMNQLADKGYLRGRIELTSDNEMNLYQLGEEYRNRYSDEFIENSKIDESPYEESEDIFKFYKTEIIVLSSLFLLVSCFIVSREVKKISVLRLQGYSFSRIINTLFLKDFCIGLLLSSIVCVGLFALFFHQVNEYNTNAVYTLVKLILYQGIICMLVMILLTILMNVSNKKPLLNQQRIHKLCMNISFVLRLLLIFVIVPQIIPIMKQLDDLTTYLYTVYQYSDFVDDYSVCHYINGYGEMSIEQEQAMKDDYAYFNDKGILFMGRAYNFADPIKENLTINENVLKLFWNEETNDRYTVCTMDSNVGVNEIGTELNGQTRILEYKQVLDLQYLLKPYPKNFQPRFIDENCVIYVPSIEKTRNVNFGNGSFFLKGSSEEVNQDLVKLGYKDKIKAISLRDKVNSTIGNMVLFNIQPIIKLIVYLFVLAIMSISTLMFYHYTYEEKNKILRTLGYPMSKIYRWIYLEVLCTSLLSLIMTYVLESTLMMFMFGYIMIDLMIFMIYSLGFSKKMLKGA